MTPVFKFSGANYLFENFTFNGVADNQVVKWGKGYHNLFGAEDASNITIQNITAQNSLGDVARIKRSSKITFKNNKIYGIGHDGLFVEYCNDVKAYDNLCYTRINSALRSRGSSDVTFRDNWIYSNSKYTPRTGPGIQVQIDEAGTKSTNVQIYGNWIEGCEGPGMWIVTHSHDYVDKSSMEVHNNVIKNCGQMQAVNKLPGVAGICLDGWNANVYDNTIDGCYGAGIRIGNYITTSVGSGYKVSLKGNIITNTKKASYPDKYSGIGLVNVRPNHVIEAEENCLNGNVSGNYYGIESENDILRAPLFVNGYHLQSEGGHYTKDGVVKDSLTSPCVFSTYELGAYNGTEQASIFYTENPDPNEIVGTNPAVIVVCDTEAEAVKLSKTIDADDVNVYIPEDD